MLSRMKPWAARDVVNVIIDTPAGSRNKYKFDPGTGLFKLSRMLPQGLHFPGQFGCGREGRQAALRIVRGAERGN